MFFAVSTRAGVITHECAIAATNKAQAVAAAIADTRTVYGLKPGHCVLVSSVEAGITPTVGETMGQFAHRVRLLP